MRRPDVSFAGGTFHKSHDTEHAPLVPVVAIGGPMVDAPRDHVVHVPGVLPLVELQLEAISELVNGTLAANEAGQISARALVS